MGDLASLYVGAWGQVDGVVGDEGGVDLPAGGGAAEDFPDWDGAGVGVDPDWHGGSFLLAWFW